jgi:hypothetical protein
MVGPSPAPLVAVQGNRLTLAADPVLHDYRPTPHEDWTSAAAMVIAGRGVGQYGIVTAHDGRPFRLYGSVHECVVAEKTWESTRNAGPLTDCGDSLPPQDGATDPPENP